jgi:hypothetical protein
MGQSHSFQKINFEDMQIALKRGYIIISTLESSNQRCLIENTIPSESEVDLVNANLKTNKDIYIIIYGENSTDITPSTKYKQLLDLGFINVQVYGGGLFEWLLLQDIYGAEEFPTNISEIDILKFKGKSHLNIALLK